MLVTTSATAIKYWQEQLLALSLLLRKHRDEAWKAPLAPRWAGRYMANYLPFLPCFMSTSVRLHGEFCCSSASSPTAAPQLPHHQLVPEAQQ